jgi:asparagine synthetase B (glutamine-hydrolysing)
VRDQLGDYHTADLFQDLYRRAPAADHLSRLQYLDIKTYLAEDILTKVDRASMAVSLEVRCPILDHVFMEYAAGIPSPLKLVGRDGKHIFKKALRGLLPRTFSIARRWASVCRWRSGCGVTCGTTRGPMCSRASDTAHSMVRRWSDGREQRRRAQSRDRAVGDRDAQPLA